ncbi:MAG: T9SS type A sorting domain-containing protein, partial [Candidatus Kapabacteria bacterium]|nr:T9SS type A sorting domain-containing protein [Candidatus Kapabacteria bacterium]
KRPSDSSPVSGEVKYNAINVAPIPATENITISIEISELTEATLSLIDQQGNEIKNFGTFVFKPGIYTQTFNSSSLSSGLYAFRLNGLTFSKIVALPVIH